MWAPVYLPLARSTTANVQLGQATVVPYQGVKAAAEGPRGGQSLVVRRQMELICEQVAPKDYVSEILAARYWVNAHAPYFRDPKNIELIRDPQAMIEAIHRSPNKVVRADCDEIALLLLALWLAAGNACHFVTSGFLPVVRRREPPHTHVFTGCLIPGTDRRGQRGTSIVVDPVAGTQEPYMLRRLTTFEIIEVG